MGGNPYEDTELEEAKEFDFFFSTAFWCLDSRYGNWLSNPLGVSVANMGIKSFEVYELIRSLYRDKIAKDMEASFKI